VRETDETADCRLLCEVLMMCVWFNKTRKIYNSDVGLVIDTPRLHRRGESRFIPSEPKVKRGVG
jgi:hypothetical protein